MMVVTITFTEMKVVMQLLIDQRELIIWRTVFRTCLKRWFDECSLMLLAWELDPKIGRRPKLKALVFLWWQALQKFTYAHLRFKYFSQIPFMLLLLSLYLVSKFLIKFSIFVALWVFFDDFYVCLVQEIATISFKNASHETSWPYENWRREPSVLWKQWCQNLFLMGSK